MARILPERTVEAWTTAYITRWFPTALLWAPTQSDPLNWDAAVGLAGHRYFVLEYKGVEEGTPTPFIPIDTPQLKAYRDDNRRVRVALVWYLLPYWTHVVDPRNPMPRQAGYRTIRAEHPGGQPPSPPEAQAVPSPRTEHALGRGCESYFYLAQPEAILQRVNRLARRPRLNVADVPLVADGVTLEHFVTLVGSGQAGATWAQLHHAAHELPAETPPRPGGGAARTTTAFAVPSTSA